MTYPLVLLSALLLLASLEISASDIQPNEQPLTNYVDARLFDNVDNEFEFLPNEQGIVEEELEVLEKPLKINTVRPTQISGHGTNRAMGQKQMNRIAGGKKVDVKGKFPWMAALLWENKGHWELFCGGSLISDRHILTASHCFDSFEDLSPSDVMVRLGDNNMNSKHASPSRRDISVSAIIIHEGYDKKTKLNDIAILQLEESIENWTDMIRPIRLPTEAHNLVGRKATVAGWGYKSESVHELSQFLMEVDVPIIEMSQCKQSYSDNKKPIVKEHICAGYPEGGKDSCKGDSGGPLMFRADLTKPWTIIGVVSWGKGCARKGRPGVYTRVESYDDWIQSTMSIV